MNEHDTLLLRRFARTGDAEAFSEITRLYAGMVYSVCLRVSGSAEHARDATQETFFQLFKSAGKVTGSLGGWLHQVATRRAADLIRHENARRKREQAFAAETLQEGETWSDVLPLVDEALTEIDPRQRDLLLRHFLQGESLLRMAAVEGVSQPTMSRRMQGALEQLRERLRRKGVGATAAALGAMMAGTAQSVPVAVMMDLGKMALAASGASAGAMASVSGLKLAVAMVAVAAGVGGWMVYQANRPVESQVPAIAAAAPVQPPSPPATIVTVEPPALVEADSPTPVAPAKPDPLPEPPAQSAASFGGMAGQRLGAGKTPGQWGWSPYTLQAPVFGGMRQGTPMDDNPSTPSGALNRFALALTPENPDRLRACFVTGAPEFDGFQRLMQNPQTDEERAMHQCLSSLGPPTEVIETTPLNDGLRVKWRALVRQEFTITENGQPKLWRAGERFELETRLKQVGAEWKVIGF